MPTMVGVMADSYNKPASGGPPLTGLAAWYDAADAASITHSVGEVTAWNDKSGNARHLTVKGGTSITTGTHTINAKNAIDFTSAGLSCSPAYVRAQPVTVFAVFKADALATPMVNNYVVGLTPAIVAFSSKWGLYAGTVVSGGNADLNAHVSSAVYNGASSQLWIDGVSNVTGNPGTLGFTSTAFAIGSATTSGTSHSWNGLIAEVLIYNVALDTTTRQQVESYLTTKWLTPSGFSPLSIPWHSAFWASDPSWIPPADGAAVSDWKNSGTAAANATQGSAPAQPTYRAAYTNLNGKPVVDFDGTGDYMDAITPSIVQPNHVFAVAWLDPTHAANPTLCDGVSSTSRHLLRNNGTAGTGFMNAGTSVTLAGGGATGSFAVAALYNQVASKYRLNGTAFTPSTVGTQSYQSVRIGASAGAAAAFYKGAIAFLGVSDIELTAQQITDLETWAKNYYGVPIP